MVFRHYNDYVIRLVGDYILLVNIIDNSIYEIDFTVKSYIEFAQLNNGDILASQFLKIGGKTIEEIEEEIMELLEVLDKEI